MIRGRLGGPSGSFLVVLWVVLGLLGSLWALLGGLGAVLGAIDVPKGRASNFAAVLGRF